MGCILILVSAHCTYLFALPEIPHFCVNTELPGAIRFWMRNVWATISSCPHNPVSIASYVVSKPTICTLHVRLDGLEISHILIFTSD